MSGGRPRKYATHAERERAYRARVQAAHAKVQAQAGRQGRRQDTRAHARYVLGTTAALALRDAPPRLLQWALDVIETGGYDQEYLRLGHPGAGFQRVLDYVYDVQAGRPLYALYCGNPLEIARSFAPGSVDVIVTDLSTRPPGR
jgi:hypothetical protein